MLRMMDGILDAVGGFQPIQSLPLDPTCGQFGQQALIFKLRNIRAHPIG